VRTLVIENEAAPPHALSHTRVSFNSYIHAHSHTHARVCIQLIWPLRLFVSPSNRSVLAEVWKREEKYKILEFPKFRYEKYSENELSEDRETLSSTKFFRGWQNFQGEWGNNIHFTLKTPNSNKWRPWCGRDRVQQSDTCTFFSFYILDFNYNQLKPLWASRERVSLRDSEEEGYHWHIVYIVSIFEWFEENRVLAAFQSFPNPSCICSLEFFKNIFRMKIRIWFWKKNLDRT